MAVTGMIDAGTAGAEQVCQPAVDCAADRQPGDFGQCHHLAAQRCRLPLYRESELAPAI